MIIGLLRHGRTEWNDARRLQGRADIPLSAAGREQVRRWRLPPGFEPAGWVASPLARASLTAALLAGEDATPAPELIEMDWGAWEGATWAELEARHGAGFNDRAGVGGAFRPPGGESQAEVQARAVAGLARLATRHGPIAAVTHKGVLRALLGAATGWDLVGKPPVRLADATLHVLEVGPGPRLRPLAWNLPLTAAEGTGG